MGERKGDFRTEESTVGTCFEGLANETRTGESDARKDGQMLLKWLKYAVDEFLESQPLKCCITSFSY